MADDDNGEDEADEPLQQAVDEIAVPEGLVRQDFDTEIWFVGAPLRDKEKKMARSLIRAHRNLGHPRPGDLARALSQDQRVDPEAVALCKRLRCATCERTRKPLPPRPTSFRTTGPFNSKICLDFVYVQDARGDGYNFLHILEPNGS